MKTKQLIITLAAVLMAYCASAQLPSDELFNKFRDRKGVRSVSVAGEMAGKLSIGAMRAITAKGINVMGGVDMAKVKKIRILNINGDDDGGLILLQEFAKMASPIMKNPKYTELMSVREEYLDFRMVAVKEKDVTKEIIIYTGSGTEDGYGEISFISYQY